MYHHLIITVSVCLVPSFWIPNTYFPLSWFYLSNQLTSSCTNITTTLSYILSISVLPCTTLPVHHNSALFEGGNNLASRGKAQGHWEGKAISAIRYYMYAVESLSSSPKSFFTSWIFLLQLSTLASLDVWMPCFGYELWDYHHQSRHCYLLPQPTTYYLLLRYQSEFILIQAGTA